MADLQRLIQDAIDEMVESGTERGMQAAVYKDGELVVDAVAGVADPATGRKVTSDTPFYNYSIAKGATTSVAHVVAERGLLSYDTRVAEIWPEFAAHGKDKVTVRHVMTHAAAVPGIPLDSTPADVANWEKMIKAIEDAEPWWEPGTKVGYHAYTYGYMIGEIVRRTTGKRISQVLLEDITTPLGIANELYLGIPESEHHRLAVLEDAPSEWEMPAGAPPPDMPMFKAAPMSLFPTATLGNRPDILSAEIPAGGQTSARAIAHVYASLLGPVDGVRLISPERLAEVSSLQASGPDQVFGMQTWWGLGYNIGRPGTTGEQTPNIFGTGGGGGSTAWADKDAGVAFALTKNMMTQDFNAAVQLGDLVAKNFS